MLLFLILLIILIYLGFTKFYIYFKGFLMHPILSIKTIPKDIYLYYKHKDYNKCKDFGYMNLYSAYSNQVFGCGKTLTMVRDALSLFNKYNDKIVWSDTKQEFVTQKVHIISNIKLYGVNYYRFIDEHQFTDFDKFGFDPDDVTIFLIDEMQALYDSRGFKDNISSDFMRAFLQCRKDKIIILGTAQRFSRCDKFLRELCSTLITCNKSYRFIQTRYYNAMSVEHCEDITLLQPQYMNIWFATDNSFNSYDTSELVEKLKKEEYISDQEIINNRDSSGTDEFLTRKHLRRSKKSKKNKEVA